MKIWLKRILRWEVAGVVFAAVALVFAYPQFVKDAGGALTVTFNPELGSVMPQAVVVDEPTSTVLDALMPSLSNSSKYSLTNYLVSYTFRTSAHLSSSSPKYEFSAEGDSYSLSNREHTLFAHSTDEPLRLLIELSADNPVSVGYTITATFDGSSKPYEQAGNVDIVYVPRCGATDQWMLACADATKHYSSAMTFADKSFAPIRRQVAAEAQTRQSGGDSHAAQIDNTTIDEGDSDNTFTMVLFIVAIMFGAGYLCMLAIDKISFSKWWAGMEAKFSIPDWLTCIIGVIGIGALCFIGIFLALWLASVIF